MTAPILALPILYAEVQQRFVDESTPATFKFGWREVARAPESFPRVLFVPGDDGNLGDVGAPRYVGTEPERALANLDELCTIYLDASDDSAPDDELAQYTAARLLFDAVYRAMYLATLGAAEVRSSRWMTDKVERRYGATLRVVIAVQAVIPDAPLTYAPRDTSAEVTSVQVSTVDQIETISPT